MRQQFAEQGNDAAMAPDVVLSLGTVHRNAAALPVHVVRPQSQVFRSAAQAAVAAEGKDQSPLGIGTGVLLTNYGMNGGATYEDGDFDGDGDVDIADLTELLGVYGTTCL